MKKLVRQMLNKASETIDMLFEKNAGVVGNFFGKNISKAENNATLRKAVLEGTETKLRGITKKKGLINRKDVRVFSDREVSHLTDDMKSDVSAASANVKKQKQKSFNTRVVAGAGAVAGGVGYKKYKEKKSEYADVQPNYDDSYQSDNYKYMTASEIIDDLFEKTAIFKDSKGVYHYDIDGDDGLIGAVWTNEVNRLGKDEMDLTSKDNYHIERKIDNVYDDADDMLQKHPLLKQYEDENVYNDTRRKIKSKAAGPLSKIVGFGIPTAAMVGTGVLNKKIGNKVTANMGKTLFVSGIGGAMAGSSVSNSINEGKRKKEGYPSYKYDAENQIYDDINGALHKKYIDERNASETIDFLFEKTAGKLPSFKSVSKASTAALDFSKGTTKLDKLKDVASFGRSRRSGHVIKGKILSKDLEYNVRNSGFIDTLQKNVLEQTRQKKVISDSQDELKKLKDVSFLYNNGSVQPWERGKNPAEESAMFDMLRENQEAGDSLGKKIKDKETILEHTSDVVNGQKKTLNNYHDNELAKSLGLYAGVAGAGKITYDVASHNKKKKDGVVNV